MDTFSSTEDMVIKTRKPYTITKQRERWTEDEHNRFLEALKLHGRAWQRIEVHIGTKSAVQIRSHAQKFFSKLEKEALVKGIPIGQAVDIKIPPPRPKRKPINPYPRKTSTVSSSLQVGAKDGKLITSFSSTLPVKQMLDLEKEPLSERTCGHEKLEKPKEHLDESNCSEILNVFREAPLTSVSSSKKSMPAPGSSSPIRELVPSVKDDDLDEKNETSVNAGLKGNQEAVDKQAVQDNTSNIASTLGSSHASQDKMVSGEKTSKVIDPQNNGHQAAQNYPRHAPVHILDWSLGLCSQMPSLDLSCGESKPHTMGAFHGHPNLYTNQTVSATAGNQDNTSKSFIHQSLPTFPFILNPVNSNQDDYPSFLHISSAFSSLIMDSLRQNPAAHAAASYAASYWPCTNVEASGDTPAAGGFPARHMNPAPSMEAIAAATVTAATAWWAAHGLLPLCAPLHAGFTCNPPFTTITSWNNAAGEGLPASKEKIANTQNLPLQDEQLDQGASEVLQAQNLASKSPTLSSSDSKVSGVAELNTVFTTPGHEKKGAGVNELNDLDKAMSKKLVDRSSCGSNTPSSSEVETDALEKHEKDKDVLEKPDTNASNLAASESSSRRSRTTNFYINESWKEVSEEGRLAFEALFSRDVLPQSFSPPHDLKDKELDRNSAKEVGKQRKDEEDKKAIQLDLFNSKAPLSLLCHPAVTENVLLRGNMEGEEGLLSMGLGQGKLKARRTGFKPYKRCAAEAKESWDGNANNQSEETCPKRIRLQPEASM